MKEFGHFLRLLVAKWVLLTVLVLDVIALALGLFLPRISVPLGAYGLVAFGGLLWGSFQVYEDLRQVYEDLHKETSGLPADEMPKVRVCFVEGPRV